MLKRLNSIFFLVICLFLLLWLIIQATKEDRLPVGSQLPELTFMAIRGEAVLHSSGKPLIVVYFSTGCEHCRYQLTVFDRHMTDLRNTNLFFLTSESDFFQVNSGIEWRNLVLSESVVFGVIAENTFSEVFGTTATPSLFFFNDSGILHEKIRGEVKAEKILEIMQNLRSGRTQQRQ